MATGRSCAAFVGTATLILSSAAAFYLAVLPMTLLGVIWRPQAHKILGLIQAEWMTLCCVLIEKLYGTKIVITGDKLVTGEKAFYISNHRTRVDWLILFCLFLRTGTLSSMKIALKAPLKKVPIFGWAMQAFMFLFLNRDWDSDRHHLTTWLSYLQSQNLIPGLLLFPEGTDLSPSNLEKSHKFSKERNLDTYQYVLHPRCTGTVAALQALRGDLEAVYDITMGYVDFEKHQRTTEKFLLDGRAPKKVVVHVCRHKPQTLPISDEQLKQWLQEKFANKEKLLNTFYGDGTMGQESERSNDMSLTTCAKSILLWLLVIYLFFKLLCSSTTFLLYVGLASALSMFITHARNGIDGLALLCFKKRQKQLL